MTRFVHDQFAKDYLEDLLKPLGEVQAPRRVAAEVQYIDIWFAPASQPRGDAQRLGLLGRFAASPSVFEPFRNAATRDEICDCLLKLLLVRREFQREANRDATSIQEANRPRLWILTPTASESLLSGFRALPDEDNWTRGVYFLADYLRTAIVAIHQLPRTQETLWLRLLGRGRVQEQAIDEVKALPETDPLRFRVLQWLERLKANLEVGQDLDEDDRRLIMRLLPLYEEQLEAARQEGQQEGLQEGQRLVVENLLRARFGSLDEELIAIVPQILRLTTEEYASLLLRLANLSREELLARFEELSDGGNTLRENSGEGEISEIGEANLEDNND